MNFIEYIKQNCTIEPFYKVDHNICEGSVMVYANHDSVFLEEFQKAVCAIQNKFVDGFETKHLTCDEASIPGPSKEYYQLMILINQTELDRVKAKIKKLNDNIHFLLKREEEEAEKAEKE